ncbi:tetratricopeptide repeat protein [Streptomyces sp. NPDC057638]|uniref:tetratricopeptide repeat protein n=1 Tax=Streptomyces sp. NPDC057638 TaxID=3346190 RepID=UPI00369F6365
MDAGLAWTALGTLGTCAGVGLAWHQARAQGRPGHDPGDGRRPPDVYGMSVTPPTGALPAEVRGRDALLAELRQLAGARRGAVVVLTGVGGVGKSTVATALAEWAGGRRRRGRTRPIWWVSAADPAVLGAGMVSVARGTGAPRADLEALARNSPDAPDRLWARLAAAPPGWLLVLDSADDPGVLTGPGWLRAPARGLVLVTSRHTDPRTWGRHARVRAVTPPDEDAATRILRDLAPAAGDETGARDLARRLGALPLALTLAGTYLDSGVARWPTYATYRRALDAHERDGWPGDPGPRPDPRTAVMRTWEISLDDLAHWGVPRARPLLRLLSCYEAGIPFPYDLLDTAFAASIPSFGAVVGDEGGTERSTELALRGLVQLSLLTPHPTADGGAGLLVHPVVADTHRIHLDAVPGGPGDPDPGVIRAAAAELMTGALGRLRYDRPADWPRYHLLEPHLRALYGTVAERLDPQRLAALARATAEAARAIDRSGAFQVGARLCRTALERAEALGGDHPAVLALRHQLAWEIAIEGDVAAAESLYREVLSARRRTLGEDHPDTRASLGALAALRRGEIADARHAV